MTPYEDRTYKEHWKEEKEKLKTMTFKDKLWYIWEYYKFPIIAVIIAVFAVTSIGSAIYQNRFDTVFACTVLNSKYESGELPLDAFVNEGFRQYIGLDENSKLDVDYSMNLTFDESAMTEYSYAEMAKVTAMISAKGLDVMIGGPEAIDHYGEMGGYSDLREVVPADLLESLSDRLYKVTNQETGVEAVCGIRLDSQTFKDDTGLIVKDPIFAIIGNSVHIDNSVSFLRYLLHLPYEIPASLQD